jgi:hypothetical protein
LFSKGFKYAGTLSFQKINPTKKDTFLLWIPGFPGMFYDLVMFRKLALQTLIIKLTLGNIFIKVKNLPGGVTVTK